MRSASAATDVSALGLEPVKSHFAVLKAAFDKRTDEEFAAVWRNYNASKWAEQARIGSLSSLPIESLNREGVKRTLALIDDPAAAAALVLAWGGMNREHGAKLFAYRDHWLDIVDKLRAGRLSRSEAYAVFADRRANGCLPGMGAPYFTKLIFFLSAERQDGRGYIMDQWTACSINLIFEHDVVDLLRGTYWVTDRNSAEVYEHFNSLIERIAESWGTSPERVEIALFDRGGRSPGPWREYVKNARRARWDIATT